MCGHSCGGKVVWDSIVPAAAYLDSKGGGNMDYYCPQAIKDEFVSATTKEIPQMALKKYLEWVLSLPVNRGDRIETPVGPGEWYWSIYEPDN